MRTPESLRDDRFHEEPTRAQFPPDPERVLTAMAFRRLAKITQVVGADERYIFHNRLTHSLQVGMTARKLAERVRLTHPKDAEELGIDPNVTEAAGLAHDLGHPPFGHVGEEELNEIVKEADLSEGFEGNAQSFRIVTRLEAFIMTPGTGLNLTRATLNALLKYPRLDTSGREKYGAYSTEGQEFLWARELAPAGEERRSVEADLMDWADDITYAVHDMADFYRAGLIPLHLLSSRKYESERRRFLDGVSSRLQNDARHKRADLERTFEDLIICFPIDEPFAGTRHHRLMLNLFASNFLNRYINCIGLNPRDFNIRIDPEYTKEVMLLKELTWHYVIHSRALATHQYGLRKIVRGLFEILFDAARKEKLFHVLPLRVQETIASAQREDDSRSITRAIRDLIEGMTEREAVDLYHRLSGVTPGSAFDHIA